MFELGPRPSAQKFEAAVRQMIAESRAKGKMPPPLTPSDCDVGSFPGPILVIARIKDSEFWIRATAAKKVAALELWMHAWRQVPAGSLPDDPQTLARVCGISVRKISLMLAGDFRHTPFHGFIRCEDRRLYHPVIAGDALRAFRTRQAREAAAAERHSRKAQSTSSPEGNTWRSAERRARDERRRGFAAVLRDLEGEDGGF